MDDATGAPAAYRVLARKYRPARFDDLIGQEALVRTLTNAFKLNRIHQAYLLTGVRGVGKTTTARILARAFNYELAEGAHGPAIAGPSIDMPALGAHCQAIIESRHVDVIEMDAASHTGVDDIREIIEGVRYRPVMARTKVYIIDEVHMLSKSAFNALLKTLEEPPDHVRFVFATTESEKVPVTVRSRCQRFDLRRVESDVLMTHLASLCEKEGVSIDANALALVARAAEGSVRDSLSLLDQAIAHSVSSAEGGITAESVRAMLGSGDRGRTVDMFDNVMRGDVAGALDILREAYDQGADPALLLTDLAEFVHFVTRLKLAPQARLDAAVTEDERLRGAEFAGRLGIASLTRAWQIISKGILDVKASPRPIAAADMVLVRLAYASDLPSPEDVLRRLSEQGDAAPPRAAAIGGGGSGSGGTAPALRAQPSPVPHAPAPGPVLARFEDVATLAASKRDLALKLALERDVRLVRFEQGRIEVALVEGSDPQIVGRLSRSLQEWTGQRWIVALSNAQGNAPIAETRRGHKLKAAEEARADPTVRKLLETFPGATIEVVARATAPEEATSDAIEEAEVDADVGYLDEAVTEEDL